LSDGKAVLDFTFIKKMINYYMMRAGKIQMTKLMQCGCFTAAVIGVCMVFFLAGCSSDGANDQGELFIKVLDAPAGFQKINIVVDRVSIHRAGASADVGWTIVSTNSSGAFDLLNLRNGRNLQLVLNKVPIGNYDRIKINYGACTILKNELEQSVSLDPSILSGNSLAYGFQIVEGEQLQLTFDFDASRSLYKIGELYYFNPVIRIQNTLLSGWITGSVLDTGQMVALATIKTYTGVDSVSTLSEFPYGSFQLSDLPERMYSVVIVPDDSLLIADTISNIDVVRQRPTNLGAIHLKHK
jgi:hypothetical protein